MTLSLLFCGQQYKHLFIFDMKINYILFLLCFIFCAPLVGQSNKEKKKKKTKAEKVKVDFQEVLENSNRIYADNIRSVKFHPVDFPLAEPIVALNSGTRLVLTFDDVDLDVKNYTYSIQQCNRDWTVNEGINLFDFLDGFENEILQEYSFSKTRYSDYVHYTLEIPNDRIRWKLSGNYILKLYDDSNDKEMVMTRRFMVSENKATIRPDIRVTNKHDQHRSHQEILFDISAEKEVFENPTSQLAATIVQNGHWNGAVTNVKPLFVKQDIIEFRQQDKVVFEAGKEWRFVDMRSLQNRLNFVEAIEEVEEGFDLLIKKEKPRAFQNYFNSADANGKFIIQNFDHVSFRRLGNQVRIDTTTAEALSEEELEERDQLLNLVEEINQSDIARNEREQHLVGEYILTYFTLAANQPFYGGDVYVFGELTDWRIEDRYKLNYNDKTLQYETELLLKQGYYNYMYAFQAEKDRGTQKFTFGEVEGNWFEADNDYTILIYYRPFGGRYDQLLGHRTFSSFERR